MTGRSSRGVGAGADELSGLVERFGTEVGAGGPFDGAGVGVDADGGDEAGAVQVGKDAFGAGERGDVDVANRAVREGDFEGRPSEWSSLGDVWRHGLF